jgi:glyoxylase-like metal-dependent hydrolase (beta-lactamase superfamily II)
MSLKSLLQPVRPAVLMGLALAAFAAPALAQPPGPPDETLSVMPLRGGVYWVSGGVSNTGFIVGDKGVVLVDPQMFEATARKELAEIARITPKPVDQIIVTHSDPDHINGLPAYAPGTPIIAHENARAEMLMALADPRYNGAPPSPALKDHLPTRTLRHTEALVLDGVRVTLLHVAPAHTDGDLIVYLPAQRIVFAGDLLTPNIDRLYPTLHLNKHGSSLGWIRSMKAMLALKADIFISGHGERLSRAELEASLKAVELRRARIKAMYEQGKSLQEIKAVLHDPPPATGPGLHFPSFVETTFEELTYE